MTALTPTVGYPPHRVVSYLRRTTQHSVQLIDWTAACGATGTAVGSAPFGKAGSTPFGKAGNARRAELCVGCFPGRDGTAYFPEPVDRTEVG